MQKYFKCFSQVTVLGKAEQEKKKKEEKLFKGEIFLKNESFWDNFSTTADSHPSNESSRLVSFLQKGTSGSSGKALDLGSKGPGLNAAMSCKLQVRTEMEESLPTWELPKQLAQVWIQDLQLATERG